MVTISAATWSCEVQGRDLIAVLGGELDLSNSDHVLERLKVEIAEVPADRVIFDLSGVSFLDSSGVRLIVKAKEAASAAGSTLLLRSVPPQAARVLEVSGVAGHLGFDVEGASPVDTG